jgi:hypothetical protein
MKLEMVGRRRRSACRTGTRLDVEQCTGEINLVYLPAIKNYRTSPDTEAFIVQSKPDRLTTPNSPQATTGVPLLTDARSAMLLLIATLIFGF